MLFYGYMIRTCCNNEKLSTLLHVSNNNYPTTNISSHNSIISTPYISINSKNCYLWNMRSKKHCGANSHQGWHPGWKLERFVMTIISKWKKKKMWHQTVNKKTTIQKWAQLLSKWYLDHQIVTLVSSPIVLICLPLQYNLSNCKGQLFITRHQRQAAKNREQTYKGFHMIMKIKAKPSIGDSHFEIQAKPSIDTINLNRENVRYVIAGSKGKT